MNHIFCLLEGRDGELLFESGVPEERCLLCRNANVIGKNEHVCQLDLFLSK